MPLHPRLLAAIDTYERDRDTRRVFPTPDTLHQLNALPQHLPTNPTDLTTILDTLATTIAPATVLTTSGRYFGFVTGGSLPAATAANILATTWDQNAALSLMSPAATHLETIALNWIAQLLHIPTTAVGTFVTGATMANFTGMAAARHKLLNDKGYDAELDGLFNAPAFPVIVGDEVHATVYKALSMLGLGRNRVIKVPTNSQGAMDPAQFPTLNEPALVCLQAGNVNTGALDSPQLIDVAKQSNSWVHVDGAFGLWSPQAKYTHADSWATDGHKWLNVPYDSGIAYVKNAADLTGALAVTASYLNSAGAIEPMQKSPDSSRRARGIDAWAALLSLGAQGVREMIETCCHHARAFATELNKNGVHILNEVNLNQVLAALDTDDKTTQWIEAIQQEGTCWTGSTIWRGRKAMRISVSSHATTQKDVERSIASMLRSIPSS
ncbi:MAG: aspartate aminotransferase family protein [Acidobacteria bacterium]|nr:aspartate aminotransferase family protein [Acidobacteriota bacterium]